VAQAEQNKLVTFGIIPSSPETGYGYIKSENPLDINNKKGSNILEFIEKPNLEIAQKFVQDSHYTWNSGIFIFRCSVIIDEINKYNPHLVETCKLCLEKSEFDLDFQRINAEAFKKSPDVAIDIAVMEKTNKGFVLPLDAGWSDIGSWEKVWEVSKKDHNGNVIQGKTFIKNTKNCLLKSENRLVVGLGIEDLIIVETSDAILVSNKNQSQEVKNIVQELKENNIKEGQKHLRTYRPWGHYISTVSGSRWQVKLIFVKPGEKTSLQMHHHRSEHWIVVSGTAEVKIDDKLVVLSENQSTYIPLGSKHRLSNPGKIPLVLIEVQSGAYVGEDDIVRFEDKYGRDK
jgi:mannose-1-phosphate guanylyltransferase